MIRRVLLVACMLAGCDEPETGGPLPSLDASIATQDGGAPVATFVVVSSDFTTATSLSLLDQDGNLLVDNYITTGSAKAGLVTALTGDVELPKASGEPAVLVIIDRYNSDVVTRVRLADGTVLGQVKVATPPTQSSTTSYSPNPIDYVYIDAQTAWVTRSTPNLESNAPEIDKGNDLYRINPSTMERANERIELGALNTMNGATLFYARPTRMARVGNSIVVGTTGADASFSSVGEGRVGIVNLGDKSVMPIALPGLKNCTGVDHVPNDPDTVLVSCGGDFKAAKQTDTAGYALLKGTTVNYVLTGSVYNGAAVSIGGTKLVASSNSFDDTSASKLAMIDLTSGIITELKSLAPGNAQFGTPAYANGLLLVSDSATDKNGNPTAGVHRFKRQADGTFSELPMVSVAKATALPARHVFPL